MDLSFWTSYANYLVVLREFHVASLHTHCSFLLRYNMVSCGTKQMNRGGSEKNELAIIHPAHNFLNFSQMIELRFHSFYCLQSFSQNKTDYRKKKKASDFFFFFLV